jgi:hypothetical protein
LNRYERMAKFLGNRMDSKRGSLASAQYQFLHLRSYTLADLFDGTANGIGSNIGDVAFDGTNLYVAGYHYQFGVQTVGMARISNFFDGTNFVASNSTSRMHWKVQLAQDGGSRDTRLVYHNGPSIWARD